MMGLMLVRRECGDKDALRVFLPYRGFIYASGRIGHDSRQNIDARTIPDWLPGLADAFPDGNILRDRSERKTTRAARLSPALRTRR